MINIILEAICLVSMYFSLSPVDWMSCQVCYYYYERLLTSDISSSDYALPSLVAQLSQMKSVASLGRYFLHTRRFSSAHVEGPDQVRRVRRCVVKVAVFRFCQLWSTEPGSRRRQ